MTRNMGKIKTIGKIETLSAVDILRFRMHRWLMYGEYALSRDWCTAAGILRHKKLVLTFFKVYCSVCFRIMFVLVFSIIIFHWSSEPTTVHLHAERDIFMTNLSVCPSVRPSISLTHAGNVSKQMHIDSNSFHRPVGAWL